MRRIYPYFICLVVSVVLYHCQPTGRKTAPQDKEPPAIAYNNKAVNLFAKNTDTIDSVEKALGYLDQAIAQDSNYLMAYTNKVNFLLALHRYDEALRIAHIIIDKKPDFTETHTLLGMIYDKLNQDSLADRQYQQALTLYEQDEADTVNTVYQANQFVLRMLLDSTQKEQVLTEIDRMLEAHPTDQTLGFTKNLIENFDRKVYINETIRY